MTWLTWPLVAVFLGCVFAWVLNAYLVDKKSALAELQADITALGSVVSHARGAIEAQCTEATRLAEHAIASDDSIRILNAKITAIANRLGAPK